MHLLYGSLVLRPLIRCPTLTGVGIGRGIAPVAAALLLVSTIACAQAGGGAGEASATGAESETALSPTARDAARQDEPRGSETSTSATTASIGAFNKARAMNHVRKLSRDIGVRVRATRRERRGIRYAARKLRDFGYRVRIQDFTVDGRTSHNVIATWPDRRSRTFVVGAHVDTVRGSPGANDNASGVAVMLENARLFAGTPQVRWVKFVAFGAEEYGTDGRHHVGSQVYVKRLGSDGRRRTAGMVSVDMVADGRPLIIGTAGIGHPRVARTIYRKLRRAGLAVDYQVTCDCSDNGPFERAGIPGAFMWSGFEPNYHDASDTVPNLRPKHLVRSGRAARELLQDIDAAMIDYFQDS